MNVNLLFKSGMRTCGRILNVLPQEDIGSPILYMTEVLREETLPSLNILLPYLLTKTLPIYALTKVNDGDEVFSNGGILAGMDNRYSAFRIPSHIVDGATIMGIKDCFPSYGSNHNNGNGCAGYGIGHMYPNQYGRYSSAQLYGASLGNTLRYADAQLVGTMIPTLRYKFYGPNIILINKPYADDSSAFVTITFKLSNDENLVTVPDTAFEGVKKLFLLDLKKSIYNEYCMFSEVDTPFGSSISLKIDDWSGAEADRDALYAEYLGTSHFRNTSMRSG